MQDEGIKRVMLSDIRSQGIREIQDSAMILRVKFKTIPGEQFPIQRQVFHGCKRLSRKRDRVRPPKCDGLPAAGDPVKEHG